MKAATRELVTAIGDGLALGWIVGGLLPPKRRRPSPPGPGVVLLVPDLQVRCNVPGCEVPGHMGSAEEKASG